jgi:Probable zinc-ribbon domain
MPDQQITCVNCKQEFTHNEEEQEFWKKMGFKNPPKRCAPCRKVRRDNGERQTSDYKKAWD